VAASGLMHSTRGVILAGQHAWSDSTFDALFPRPLLPVANQPLVSYAVRWLHEGGLRDITVCTNGETRVLGARLEECVPDGPSLEFHEDAAPRGPAGCVRDAAAGGGETFVVADGTTVPLPVLGTILASHRASGAALTVVVHPEPGCDGEAGWQVPSGIYVFERRALEYVPAHGFCDIKESLIPRLYRAGERTLAYPVREASPRALDGPTYLMLNGWMVERLGETPPAEGFVRTSGLLAHKSAQVAPDVVCVGPVLVGPGVQVMAGATLVGPTSIGAGSTVAAGALVSRSALWSRCLVGEKAEVDQSILTNGSMIAPRARLFRSVRAPAPGHRPTAAPSAKANRFWPYPFRDPALHSSK